MTQTGGDSLHDRLASDATAHRGHVTRASKSSIKTTFADGKADQRDHGRRQDAAPRSDAVAPDTIVLPNAFLGSYAALARRLVGARPGATFRAYIAPAGGSADPRRGRCLRTASRRRSVRSTRRGIRSRSRNPSGELQRQPLDRARRRTAARERAAARPRGRARGHRVGGVTHDVVLAADATSPCASRRSGSTLPAAWRSRPAPPAKLPAIVLVGGSGPTDRDSTVFGIPIMGQIARGARRRRLPRRPLRQARRRPERRTRGGGDDRRLRRGRARGDFVAREAQGRRQAAHRAGRPQRRRVGGAGGGRARQARDGGRPDCRTRPRPAPTVVLEQQAHLLERTKTPDAERRRWSCRSRSTPRCSARARGKAFPIQLRKTADTPWFQQLPVVRSRAPDEGRAAADPHRAGRARHAGAAVSRRQARGACPRAQAQGRRWTS